MPSPIVPKPVEVNLNVSIDASGNIDVFSHTKPTVGNIIIANETLLVNSLYDEALSRGLIELWEPSNAQGAIKVQLANTNQSATGGPNFSGAYEATAKVFASQLQNVLCHSFDCSGDTPFSLPQYKANSKYYNQRDFGRVALATYAHYMFGHVDATAAITNDINFVKSILSISDGAGDETETGGSTRAASWTKTNSITGNVKDWNDTCNQFDANLAVRLVKKIVSKGLDASGNLVVSDISGATPTMLSHIAAQVVGQDASRLMNVDNSQRTVDRRMLLRFYPGDVIYVNITLNTPTINIGLNQKLNVNELYNLYNTKTFTIKITLGGVSEEFVTQVVNQKIESIVSSPATTDVTELKTFLSGFTTANPAPVPTITVTDVPVTSLITTAASSFDTNATYEVNFVLLTNNTATVDTTKLTENSVLYIPATSGTPITLVTPDSTYTISTTVNNTVLVNGTSYTLGQKVTIGGKQFVVAFTGSVGLIVQNSSPGIAKLATRFGNTETFHHSSIACDSAGNVYVRVRASSSGFTIYNYASAPVNGGEIPTSIYGTIAGGSMNYLLKYNSSGICQWAVRTPTVRDADGFNRIVCDSENNVYIAGTNGAGSQPLFNFSSAPVNGGAVGNTQYGILATPNDQGWARQGYLIKYTTNGTVAWATRTLYIGGADFTSHSLTVDKDNNVYFGFGDRTGSAGGIAFHSYASPPANSTSNINTTLYGSFRPAVTITQLSLFFTKYNSSGQIQHILRIDNISPDGETLHSITCDNSGSLIVATPARPSAQVVNICNPVRLTSSSGFFDFTVSKTMNIGGTVGAAIIKFNSAGVCQWATCQQFPIWYTRQPCISCDNDNNLYYVTTMLNSGGGRTITYKNFSGFSGNQITTTNYGTLMIGDGTAVHIAKLNSNGVMQWVSKIEGENTQFAFNSTSDIAGNVYIGLGHGLIGSAGSPRLFNYTSAPVNQGEIGLTLLGRIQNVGGQDVHLIKYNTNGSVVWGTRVAGTLDEQTCEVALDSTDHVWLTGIYRSNPVTVNNYVAKPTTNTGFMTLEPFGTLADINTSSGQNNVFIAKFGV